MAFPPPFGSSCDRKEKGQSNIAFEARGVGLLENMLEPFKIQQAYFLRVERLGQGEFFFKEGRGSPKEYMRLDVDRLSLA